ncbi:protein ACCELERATED CELL DEATH 6-like protein [Cinnamomum micranthum f. kanehirae]|uniref:Protein ACCELERATED CELL DEATH 6-like protein n=1 Tax=Cinnamomum micranthum f. kanehirae TaxID=337451 RepID=A0A443PBU3_9MAGN|nr:protein ACCELERATED CELL DEATH 6-like protein [Cinnamomum micranthum f. kanehirae]
MDPRLFKAAMNGDMKLLTSIVEVDCPPNLILYLTPQKNTALHIAVEFERQEIVQRMIQLCPSLISQPNPKGDTPLHVAARAGHLGLTQLLTPALNLAEGNPTLEEGNPVRQAGNVALRMSNLEGSNPIHEARKKSHGEVALHLLAFEKRHELAREVNVAGESLLYLATEVGLDKVVQKIIDTGDYNTQGPDGQNPLHIAVLKGRLGVVEILLNKERNFIPQADRFGNTVLHYASARNYYRGLEEGRTKDGNHIKILESLLKANPSLAYVPNRNGDYPLFIAIRKHFVSAVCAILDHCPDSAELVNQKGQNALHVAVMEKNRSIPRCPSCRLEFEKMINEPDSDGNTPMHLAPLTNDERIVKLLINLGTVDLTMSNKEGRTAMDICGYTEREHPIRDTLRESGAVPGRHKWQERFPPPPPPRLKKVKISPEFKKLGLQTLPIVTSLVATVTFAAAFTVPGGYKNDGPREGLPVFMRNVALQAFVLLDILAFCSFMAATVLIIYANAHSEDAFKIHHALQTCYYISGVAIVATISAFLTAVYVLTSKESLWLAVTSMVLGFAVPLFLACYTWFLKKRKWNLYVEDDVEFLFAQPRDNVY